MSFLCFVKIYIYISKYNYNCARVINKKFTVIKMLLGLKSKKNLLFTSKFSFKFTDNNMINYDFFNLLLLQQVCVLVVGLIY